MSKTNYCIVCHRNKAGIEESHPIKSLKTFYSFPTCPKRRENWLNILDLKDTKVTSRCRVCELHFSKSQFVRTRLKKDAIPSLNPRVTKLGSTAVLSNSKSIKPSQNSLVPVLLFATPVTPVPVLQLPPPSQTQTTPSLSSQFIPSQGKKSIPPAAVPPQSPSSSSSPLFDAVELQELPRPTTPFPPADPLNYNHNNCSRHPPELPKGNRTTSKPTSYMNANTADPQQIPESLRQFLQQSLKKEVADKVLKDADSVGRFCHRVLSEVQSWKKLKSHSLSKSNPQQPGISTAQGQSQSQVNLGKPIIVGKEKCTKGVLMEKDDLLYPSVTLKVEEEDGLLHKVLADHDDNDDPLGDGKAGSGQSSVEDQHEFMEWHDESELHSDSEETDTAEDEEEIVVKEQMGNESVLGL